MQEIANYKAYEKPKLWHNATKLLSSKIPQKREPYCVFPTYIMYDLTLPFDAKIIYVLLCTYANNQSGTAFPTVATISRNLGISEDRVRKI
jgi:hypothetical protein